MSGYIYITVIADQAKKKKVSEAREKGLPPPPPKKKNIRQPPLNHKIAHDVTETLQHSRDSTTASETSTPPTVRRTSDASGKDIDILYTFTFFYSYFPSL